MLKAYRTWTALLCLVAALFLAAPAQAQIFGTDPDAGLSDADRNVFFFGGRFHTGSFYITPAVWSLPYEDSYFVGAGYQQFFYRSDWSFRLGAEVGAAARIGFDGPSSAEVWAGLVFRHDGIAFFDSFRLSPALTTGFSVVSAPIGSEAGRAEALGKDVTLLVYLGPEISITPVDNPNIEGFFRVQHRSGAFGFIMDGMNGSNAATAGIRFKF